MVGQSRLFSSTWTTPRERRRQKWYTRRAFRPHKERKKRLFATFFEYTERSLPPHNNPQNVVVNIIGEHTNTFPGRALLLSRVAATPPLEKDDDDDDDGSRLLHARATRDV